jgi:hypothetical protein
MFKVALLIANHIRRDEGQEAAQRVGMNRAL